MAKTYPTDFPTIDPTHFTPDRDILTSHMQSIIEGQNWAYALVGKGGWHFDYRENVGGAGIHQGYLSDFDVTVNSLVECLNGIVVGGPEPDNNNLWRVTTVALAAVLDATVKVEFVTTGGAIIDTVTHTHPVAGTQPSTQTTTVSGGALDGGTEYEIKVYLMAGNDPTAYVLLYRGAVDQLAVPTASLP